MNTIDIQVDSREVLDVPYSVIPDGTNPLDISEVPFFLEIYDLGLRKPLDLDPENPLGRRLHLTLSEVARLPQVPCEYTVRNDATTKLEWRGTIVRTGHLEAIV